MKNKPPIKLAFLFGAGAEGPGSYGIPLGFEYLRKTLFDADVSSRCTKALKRVFTKEYFDKYRYSAYRANLISPILQNLLCSKIMNEPLFLRKHVEVLARILSDQNTDELCEDDQVFKIIQETNFLELQEKKKDSKRNTRTKIESELKEILKGKKDSTGKIEHDILRELIVDSYGEIRPDYNIGIAGELDRYFHTIINPDKYSRVNFSKIVNYYWCCYFVIVEAVVKYLGTEGLEEYLGSGGLDYIKIARNVHHFTGQLYGKGERITNQGTYYTHVKRMFDGNKGISLSGIATTNYFCFAESTGAEVAYLNGKLKWFEFPERLEVIDCENDDHGEGFYFPFIFGQSLVKPVVHPKQIEEFHHFKEILNESDVLVILGYQINDDDNHINAFLHDFIRKSGKRLIVVRYKNHKDIAKKLQSNDNSIEYLDVDYDDNSRVISELAERILEARL